MKSHLKQNNNIPVDVKRVLNLKPSRPFIGYTWEKK